MPELGDALAQIVDTVELAEYRQILPHREPHRHFDIGALEIHAMQNTVALLRHLRAEHVTRPDVGVIRPMMLAMVVVLPAPLPPSRAVIVPGASVNEMPSTAGTVL